MRLLSFAAVAAPLALASELNAQQAALAGVVWDSVARAPLPGAMLQLAGVSGPAEGRRFTATTDSAGRYRIDSLPAGTYAAEFYHQRLDSLGLEPITGGLRLAPGAGAAGHRLDLATPSPAALIAAHCGPAAAADSTGLLLGHVRDAETEMPVGGVPVAVRWTETVIEMRRVRQQERVLSDTASESGFFAICGIPADAAAQARAGRGADSSGLVPVDVPAGEVAYAAIHVGGARRVAMTVMDSSGKGKKPKPAQIVALRGTARLTGVVHRPDATPAAGARVVVRGTQLEATAGPRGVFSFDSLPAGTHTVEVRALGFLPVQSVVHLSAERPASVDIRLTERVVALPNVKVKGQLVYSRKFSPNLAGFYERLADQEKGIIRGYFFTREDIEKRNPVLLTQMFRDIPALQIVRSTISNAALAVTVAEDGARTGEEVVGRNNCRMTVYLDGLLIASEMNSQLQRRSYKINQLASPNSLAGMEVYISANDAPPRYQSENGSCGVILIWTK